MTAAIDRLTGIVRNAELTREHRRAGGTGGSGRNQAASIRSAEARYRDAVADVVRLDDELGTDDPRPTRLDARLRRVRDRAIAVGLLSTSACVALEAEAIELVDREAAR